MPKATVAHNKASKSKQMMKENAKKASMGKKTDRTKSSGKKGASDQKTLTQEYGKKSDKKSNFSQNMKMTQDGEKEKAKRRFKVGTVAIREIKRYQKSTKLILPRLSFQRVIR